MNAEERAREWWDLHLWSVIGSWKELGTEEMYQVIQFGLVQVVTEAIEEGKRLEQKEWFLEQKKWYDVADDISKEQREADAKVLDELKKGRAPSKEVDRLAYDQRVGYCLACNEGAAAIRKGQT